MPLGLVALVGAPNVGKSTLFNRMLGKRLSIVEDSPGITRDRLYGTAEWLTRKFRLVDTGGIEIKKAPFQEEIRAQATIAIEEADVIVFVVDGKVGVTSDDMEVAKILYRSDKPVLLAVNKIDNADLLAEATEFYSLGLGDPIPCSGSHGIGVGDLLDKIVSLLPTEEEDDLEGAIAFSFIGRPNVGKSSLTNRLLGETRVIVKDLAGTTRDSIDTPFEKDGVRYVAIDTAGLVKKGRIYEAVDKYAALRALAAIDRSQVAVLVIDASTGVIDQDRHVCGYALDAHKGIVVVVNKWDAIEKDTYTMQQFTEKIRKDLNFMDYVPILFVSAKTGQRTNQILTTALQVQEQRLVRIPTSALNDAIHEAQDKHHATSKSGRSLQMYYATQVRSDPPTFMIYVNDPDLAHFTYKRYLENQLRERFGFIGTPIRFVFKARR